MTSADLFHSTAFVLARNVTVLVALVFWLALALWVYRDARRRLEDPVLIMLSTLVALVPPYFGPLVYLLLRPAETIDDRRSRAFELRALQGVLGRPREACPSCAAAVEPDFLVCPVCTQELREACTHCSAALEPGWQVCPFCATAAGRAAEDLDAALSAEAALAWPLPGRNGSLEPQPAES